MRLTLRTLLAYLDGMLPQEDAKAIADKLDTSELASGLVHRIRSSTRKMRLSAPPPNGRGMGSDANTVAEYLDNTLPAESITDFERVCLESDMHLAEAAACHQILTMVLAQPAEIAPELRETIYALSAVEPSAAESSISAESLAAADGAEAVTPPPQVQTREVPEYLRRRPWNWKAAALVVALTFVLVFIGLRAMGPFNAQHPVIGGMFSTQLADEEGAKEDRSKEVPGDTSDRDTSDSDDSDGDTSDGDTSDGDTSDGDDSDSGAGGQTDTDAAGDGGGSSTGESTADGQTGNGTAEGGTPDKDMPVGDSTTNPTTDSTGADSTGADSTGADSAGTDGGKPATSTDPMEAGTPDETGEPTATEVGRFLASGRPQFLARKSGAGDWLRLPPRTVLQTGDRLLVLPTYRPQVALTSGVQMTLVGPAEAMVHREDPSSRLELPYGRVLLDTAGVAGATIRLQFAHRAGTITFANPESTLAVSVKHVLPPGQDPATTARVETIALHATSGTVQWKEEGDEKSVAIEVGTALFFAEGPRRLAPVEDPVPWVDGDDLREIDLRASRELEPLLDTERPLRVNLLEQADARQVEVSALAIQSLGFLGVFDQAVNSFNDERQRSYWRYHLAMLLDRVGQSAEDAAEIKAALGRLRESDAQTMYKILWGYTQSQLDQGEAAKLVGFLESEHMDLRVLAIETLRTITGGKTHLYRPERLPIQQKKSIQDWKNNLENNLIRYPENT